MATPADDGQVGPVPRSRPYDAAAYDRRGRRFLLGTALVQLLYLAWPVHALVVHIHATGRVIPVAAVLACTVVAYVWAAWRATFHDERWPAWATAGGLTLLGVTLPFVYGPFVLGFPLYAAILLGLVLPVVPGLLAILGLAGLTAAVGVTLPSSPFVAIALLTALLGVVVLAATRLLTANRELLTARAEIARLAAGEERLRLARELHDAVKQQVFVAAMEIGAASALLRRDSSAAEGHLGDADTAVRDAQRELAGVIDELRPSALGGRPLAGALREYVTSWSKRHDIAADMEVRNGGPLPSDAADALFLAAREALANAARHSESRIVTVTLSDNSDTVTLTVADDGRGVAEAAVPSGHGLAGMRERMAAIGGTMRVDSEPGAGTRVTLTCPARQGGGR